MTQEIELGSIGFTDKHEWVSGYSQVIDGTDTPGYSVNDVVHTTNGVWCSKVDGNTANPDTDTSHTYWEAWLDATEVNEKAQKVNGFVDGMTDLHERVANLEMFHDPSRYAVAAWNNSDLNPAAIEFYGDKSVVDDYKFMLIDTTDNAGQTTGWKCLKRNNLLRFNDGSFAPTVGITQDMYNQCRANATYLLNEGSTYSEVYASGAYDPEAEWEIDKALIQAGGTARDLYILDADGVTYSLVTHKLRPWETVETKYTIGIGMDHDVYLLDNVIGKSGKAWQGLFLDPVTWDGIDVAPYKLAPTAIAPSPVCTVGGKTRSFFYLYQGETNCQGYASLGCEMFHEKRTYPRTADVTQMANMNYARANNADNTLSYPFAEGGYHALNTYNVALEVLYGTRYIHGATRFGSGISSNDTCSNETTWLANGGWRVKAQSSSTWSYAAWGSSNIVYSKNDGKTKANGTSLNGEAPKEQCMESQMAFSYAMELGIAEGVRFEFYGGTYWYQIVPDTSGIDKMNVRVYTIKTGTINAFDSTGAETIFDVEGCLRMSLFGGMNASGDIFVYWGGGYEQVGTCVKTVQGSTGHPVDLYLQPDQTKWVRETGVSKANLGCFDFEDSYLYTGQYANLGDSYALARRAYTGWRTAKGASTSNGMCYYQYDNNYWNYSTLDTRTRVGARFRGAATYAYCSRRFLYAFYAVSYTRRFSGGSAQCLIAASETPQG